MYGVYNQTIGWTDNVQISWSLDTCYWFLDYHLLFISTLTDAMWSKEQERDNEALAI